MTTEPKPLPRLILLSAARDADGEVRIAILPPGPWAVPEVFASVAAALAALRGLEAAP